MTGKRGVSTGAEVRPKLGRYVLRLRKQERGLTQVQVAEATGLSADTIRRLEHGDFSPTVGTLEKLCKGFGISLATFFAGYDGDEQDRVALEVADMVRKRPCGEQLLIVRTIRALVQELDFCGVEEAEGLRRVIAEQDAEIGHLRAALDPELDSFCSCCRQCGVARPCMAVIIGDEACEGACCCGVEEAAE